MPDRHQHPPISFRPPEGDRLWLLAYAKQTSRPVNAVLAAALSMYRQETEMDEP